MNNLRLDQIDQGIRADDLIEGGGGGGEGKPVREVVQWAIGAADVKTRGKNRAAPLRECRTIDGRDLFTQQEWGTWKIGPMIG